MVVQPEDLARRLIRRHGDEQQHQLWRAAQLRAAALREARRIIDEGLAARGWLVGSVAWGGFGPRSDVDLVLEGLEPRELATIWDRLCASLQTTVDLLRLEELPEAFCLRVQREGVAVHDR